MKKTLILHAPAKINIGLWVKEKRRDGFHEIETIMQTISLVDTITLHESREPGIFVTCDHPLVPSGPENLAYKAAQTVLDSFGIPPAIQIQIQKRIPVAAGLAGGSSDAAAVIEGIPRLYEKSPPMNELMNLAQTVGSDIPFLLKGGTALASGRGEMLSFLESPRPPFSVLVVIPKSLGISTKWVYENFRCGDNERKEAAFPEIFPAIKRKDFSAMRRFAFNDLESVTLERYPVLGGLKARMAEAVKDSLVLMSGSGPSIVGLYSDKKAAAKAAAVLDPASMDIFLEHTTRHTGR